jgi:hypothetical protein
MPAPRLACGQTTNKLALVRVLASAGGGTWSTWAMTMPMLYILPKPEILNPKSELEYLGHDQSYVQTCVMTKC